MDRPAVDLAAVLDELARIAGALAVDLAVARAALAAASAPVAAGDGEPGPVDP